MSAYSPPTSTPNSLRLARAYFGQLRDLGEERIYCSAPCRDPLLVGPSLPAGVSLEAISETIASCQKCGLHRTRTRVVPGAGNPSSGLVLIGEAPGHQEDRQGLPFVGPSGQLLRRLFNVAGIPDDRYYLVNVLKCRPPGNRDPLPEEIESCTPYLRGQLAALAPQIVVCLGRFAGRWVLGSEDLSLRAMRSSVHQRGEALVVVTYHPSALLHKTELRAEAWRDIKRISGLVRERLTALQGGVR